MTSTTLLTKKEIASFVEKDSFWSTNKSYTKLTATASFSSHIDALTFIMRVSIYAQIKQHHPDITFTYAKVKISLSTHDAGGVTVKDIQLAKIISRLYQQ